MEMKQHILAALREKFEDWEELLGGLSEERLSIPLLSSDWSTKDVIVHLWAWQQRSIARAEAALRDREPQFPRWPAELDPDGESVDRLNAWIYETHRERPWPEVHENWRAGFQRLLDLSGQISERDLLDTGRYPWLKGYSMAFILLATYDHHQEHFEKLLAWLQEHKDV
jgi:hypothetical protein